MEGASNWVTNTEAWGPTSHGVLLHINPDPFYPRLVPMCIDVETDERDNFVGIGICASPNDVYYYTNLSDKLKACLENLTLIGHNLKSDVQWLRKWGVNVKPEQMVYDTMLASYVQDSTKPSHSLKDLAKEILGYDYPSYKELTGTGKAKETLDKKPVDLTANYCGMDALSTYRLYQYFGKALSPNQKRYLEMLEMPTMQALMLMEERGVNVDAAYLRTLDYRFNVELQRLVERIKLRAPSIENINSDKQVGDFLVSKGINLPKTETGRNSVSVKSLEPYMGIPFIASLGRYSELEKLTGTYTKPLIDKADGAESYRLHTTFNQAVTHTGRLSSSKPNLQNIPTRTNTGDLVRSAFVAKPETVLIDADYSQIEPRLFAHFSQDPELLKIFREGLDLYDTVAAAIGCDRPTAKTVWLALSYNAGAFKISQTAKIQLSDAYKFVDKMKQKFKTAFGWKESVIRQADSDKYVETLFGRRIKLSEPSLAPNYKVQGSAAEIMKKAIIATKHLSQVLTVHDELLFEDYGEVPSIKDRMESVVKLTVPLVVEVGVGKSWAEAKG